MRKIFSLELKEQDNTEDVEKALTEEQIEENLDNELQQKK